MRLVPTNFSLLKPSLNQAAFIEHKIRGAASPDYPAGSKFLPKWKTVSDRYSCAGAQLVSVVIPCFNYGRYLAEALDSVIQQTYRRLEIIIVNDGSTDHTADVAKDFIRRHPDRRVRLINQENSGQPAISRNKGIGEASGAYILPLDADDALDPSMIGECVELLEHNPAIGIAYTDRQDFDGASGVVAAGEYDFAKLPYANQISYCALFRKEVWTRVGGYRTNVKGLEDWDFWIAAGSRGFTGWRIPKPLFKYRRHDQGVYQEAVRGFARKFAQIVLNNREAYLPRDIEKAERILEKSCCEKPEVSVIIPTYNRPDMLAEAVRSALGQTFQNLEILVVNDAGLDVAPVIARCNDARIRLVNHSANRGLAAARNTGIRQAEGMYIALLDDDDCFYPNHLETAIEDLRNGWKVVYTDAVRAEYAKSGKGYELSRKHVPYSMDFERDKLLIGNIAPVNCFVFERRAALEAGLFDETFNALEDWEFWLRLSAIVPFRHICRETVQVNWRTDGSTMTSSRRTAFQRNRDRIYKRYRSEIMAIPHRDRIIEEFQAIWRQDERAWKGEADMRPGSQQGLVSIIILTFNQLHHTRACLESLRRCTPERHEIILVDNGSADGTVDYLREVTAENSHCRLIENGRNLGFAAGNNIGVRASRGDYVLLLNNDVVVTPGWLNRLVKHAEAIPSVGIVGPMSNETSGLQRVGLIRYHSQTLDGLDGFARETAERHLGTSHPHWKVVGFCMLIKREVIDRIGGLDPRFGIGNFEDDDFCLRAHLAGFRCRIAEDCFVHHFGSASFRSSGIDYDKLLRTNWEIFKRKWNIPPETDLRREYRVSLKGMSFDPARHHVPLIAAGHTSLEAGIGPGNEPGVSSTTPRHANSMKDVIPEPDNTVTQNGGSPVNSYEKMYDDLRPLLSTSRPEDALIALRQVVGSFPDFAGAHNDIGSFYYKTGDSQKALGHLQRAVELCPGDPGFRKDLGDLYYAALQRTGEALECYAEVLRIRPGDAETLATTAHLLVSLRRFEEAQTYYQRVLAVEPWNTQAQETLAKLRQIGHRRPASGNPVERYQNLQPLMQGGDPHEAISKLEALVLDHPTFAPAHNDLGVLYYRSGQKEKTLWHYEEAVRLQPGDVTFQKNLADFYYVEQNRIEDALRVYLRVLEIDAEDIEALMALGKICTELHKDDDARTFYERILEIEPWNTEARQSLEHLEQRESGLSHNSTAPEMHAEALRLASSGESVEALKHLERLLEIYPDFALAHNDLAVLAYQGGDRYKSLEHYESAARLEPMNATFRKNLADCYWIGFGRNEDALRTYVNILETHPEDIETLLGTGKLCKSLGKADDAKVFFERILEIEPWNSEARGQLEQVQADVMAA